VNLEDYRRRFGSKLVMRFFDEDHVVTCVRHDAAFVYWQTESGEILGRMTTKLWDLNLRRQGVWTTPEGGQP